MKRLLSIKMAAEEIGVSRNTFRDRFLKTGLIPFVEIGKRTKIDRFDIDSYLLRIKRREYVNKNKSMVIRKASKKVRISRASAG